MRIFQVLSPPLWCLIAVQRLVQLSSIIRPTFQAFQVQNIHFVWDGVNRTTAPIVVLCVVLISFYCRFSLNGFCTSKDRCISAICAVSRDLGILHMDSELRVDTWGEWFVYEAGKYRVETAWSLFCKISASTTPRTINTAWHSFSTHKRVFKWITTS